jgi:hypothetical protein
MNPTLLTGSGRLLKAAVQVTPRGLTFPGDKALTLRLTFNARVGRPPTRANYSPPFI